MCPCTDCLTNIYDDENAYVTYTDGFRVVPKPASRNMLGQVRATLEQANHMELALGTKTRSAVSPFHPISLICPTRRRPALAFGLCGCLLIGWMRLTCPAGCRLCMVVEQGQFDIWEAVYSPQGDDGYPKRLFDKKTGAIDHEVTTPTCRWFSLMTDNAHDNECCW